MSDSEMLYHNNLKPVSREGLFAATTPSQKQPTDSKKGNINRHIGNYHDEDEEKKG